MNKAIFEYIRKREGGKVHKVGIIIGLNDNGTIRIGWSKCNMDIDKFDQLLGFQFAFNRAMKPDNVPTPHCIKTQIRRFGSRAVRYFKNAKRLELPV